MTFQEVRCLSNITSKTIWLWKLLQDMSVTFLHMQCDYQCAIKSDASLIFMNAVNRLIDGHFCMS